MRISAHSTYRYERLRLPQQEWLWAAAFYLGLAAALLWPAIVAGSVPLPLLNVYAQGDPAWAALRPTNLAPGTNLLLGDISGFYYPYVVFTIRSLRAGEFPLWNPYTFGGMPYFAANQAALLYPINLLTFWLGPHAYWAASALLRIALSGLGMCLLARRLGISRPAALLAGGVYALADFNVVWLHFAIHNVAALLPLALWLIHRLLSEEPEGRPSDTQPGRRADGPSPLVGSQEPEAGRLDSGGWLHRWLRMLHRHRASFLGLATVVAAQMFGGHPEMSLFFMVICVAFAFAWAPRDGQRPADGEPATGGGPGTGDGRTPGQDDGRIMLDGLHSSFVPHPPSAAGPRWGARPCTLTRWSLAAVALALGLALSAVQWAPTLALVRQSYTFTERGFAADYGAAIHGDYAPLGGLRRAGWENLRHWLLLVAPQLWGTPRGERIYNWAPDRTNYNEMTPYVGLAALGLAIMGALRGRNRRAARFFGVMLLAALLLLYPLPGLRLLGFLPLLHVAYGFRFGLAVALAAAVLAGLGLDWLRAASLRGRLVAAGLLLALAGLSFAVVADLWGGPRAAWALGFAPGPAVRAEIAAVYQPGNWRLFVPAAGGVLGALALLGGAGVRGQGSGIGRPAATVAGGWSFAPLLAVALAELAFYGYGYNGFTPPQAIYPETPALARLRQASADYRALTLDGTLWANTAMVHGIRVVSGMDDLLPEAQKRFLKRGLAGLTPTSRGYVVTDWGQRLMDVMNVRYVLSHQPVRSRATRAQLPVVLRDGALLVSRNDTALPRAYAATAAVLAAPGASEDAVFDRGFDPHRAVVLEDAATVARLRGPAASVTPVPVVAARANRVEVQPDLAAPAVVVLTESYDPDWRVTIDGTAAPLLRANAFARGVFVPAGRHTIVFEYRPRLVGLAGLASLAALALGIGLAARRLGG